MTHTEINERLAKAMGWLPFGHTGDGAALCDRDGHRGLYNFTKSRDDLAIVEAEIERRGLRSKYVYAISDWACEQFQSEDYNVPECPEWHIRTCPPAVAAPIALAVLKGGGK